MRFSRPIQCALRGVPAAAGLLLVAPALSAETSPARTEPRVEAAARVGVMFPGEISPVNWFRTEAKMAPSVWLDGGFVLHPNFSVGPILQLTPFAFDRMSGDNVIGDGSGTLFSVGAAAKARLRATDAITVRGGLLVTRNFVSYDGQSTGGGSFELSGGGFGVGAAADLAYQLSQKLGLSAQLAFFGQPSGSANVKGYPTNATAEGEERDFGFKPLFFFTAGPELYF